MKIENFEKARKLLSNIKDIELRIQNVDYNFQKEDHLYVDEDILKQVSGIMKTNLEQKRDSLKREFEAL